MNIASRRSSVALLRTIVVTSALVVTGAHLAVAQDAQASAQPAPAKASAARPAPAAQARRDGLPTKNVRVAVTITDQVGAAGQPVVKTVSMVIADDHSNQVRSVTRVQRESMPAPDSAVAVPGEVLPLMLNLDAKATVTAEALVLLELRFTYRIAIGSAGVRTSASTVAADALVSEISEEMTLLVKPGTSVMAAESADATSDRKVKVEVRADILP